MSDLPRSAVVRTAKLASLPLGVAGRTAIGLGKRLGGMPAEAVTAELQARTAAQLFSVLGELKGGAMKVGQALSVMEAAMPEELAGPYRATLTRLQEAAPPMAPATVHNVLATELGPRWRSAKFRSFDDVPAAAASIGQVHKAVWRDGREVAVKIQYPGAADALLSDLTQLSRVARVATAWIPGLDIKPITEELTRRMGEELDYDLEAKAQTAFFRGYRGDPHVVVPEVLAHSEHVIVSEWVDGTPLSQIIASGTPQKRDHAALRFAELLIGSPERIGLLHADPHPGNFRITPDGRLAVLDFGLVNRLPHGLPPAIGEVFSRALAGHSQLLTDELRREGFLKETMQVDPDTLLAYLSPFLEPIRDDEFTFTREWLRGIAGAIQDPRRQEFTTGLKLNLPPAYVLIHRVWLGGIGVLCQIGGTVPAREIVLGSVPGVRWDIIPDPAT